jgi:metal-dependent amidase/aminoacylase/carboxypeptidase family protein
MAGIGRSSCGSNATGAHATINVIPAEAGIQCHLRIPAFAGMTKLLQRLQQGRQVLQA